MPSGYKTDAYIRKRTSAVTKPFIFLRLKDISSAVEILKSYITLSMKEQMSNSASGRFAGLVV